MSLFDSRRLQLADGDCDLWNEFDMGSGQLTKVAEVVTVVEGAEWLEVVERWVEAVGGDGEGGAGADASCCNSVVRVAFSCCCFFFTSCSADLRSSSWTPCAFLGISDEGGLGLLSTALNALLSTDTIGAACFVLVEVV